MEERGLALLEMFQYFTELTASRRANPTDDLASTIANATINGEPLDDIATVSYYAILAAAGHDTSSASISGPTTTSTGALEVGGSTAPNLAGATFAGGVMTSISRSAQWANPGVFGGGTSSSTTSTAWLK